VALLVLGCAGGDSGDGNGEIRGGTMRVIQDVPARAWEALAANRIYFGHQSVGFNIVDGMKDLAGADAEIVLNIQETKSPAAFQHPVFAHSRIGRNMDPRSKIDDFRSILESGVGALADTAFMKLCYVDISGATDVPSLLDHYRTTMSQLRSEFPSLQLIHVTVPLMALSQSLKDRGKRLIKKILGKPKREQYNRMLRETYEGREPVFDLALAESTLPDGTRCAVVEDGERIACLVPAYTDDGGHLNETGRRWVAARLLRLLAETARKP